MEKNERTIKKSFIIICIFYIGAILTTTVFLASYQNTLKNEKIIKEENNSILLKLKNTLASNQDKEKQLQNEILDLKNTKENTKKIMQEVFELASTLENEIKNKKNNSKIAYLTFDDGPYYLTNSFLDILDKYEIKATFFTMGWDKDLCFDDRTKDCSIMYKKITDKGHTIANHTYYHNINGGLYDNVNSFIYQIELQEKNIKDKTGITTNIMRFPGGSAQSKHLKNSIIEELRKKGYGWVDWTALNGDGGHSLNGTQAWNNFVSSINENIEVVLLHDYNYITLSMLPNIIEYLQNNNYIILPLFYESIMVNK